MNLKGLVHRELGEGLTEKELASAIDVSVQTITNILVDQLPEDPAIWEKFARYFRIHADFLRTGGPPHSEGTFELTESAHHSPVGQMRKVPLLRWDQIDQMTGREEPPRLIHAEALLNGEDMMLAAFGTGRDEGAFGLFGGQASPLSRMEVQYPDGKIIDMPAQANVYNVPPGTILRKWNAGGGGFGEPRERARDRIERDVREGYVSRKDAERIYGFQAG